MSKFVIGNLFLLVSMISTAGSQILIKRLLVEVPDHRFDWNTLNAFMEGTRPLRGGLAMTGVVFGFVFWVLCLGKLNLTYAYPIGCSSVLLVSLLSLVFLDEPMTLRMWFGTTMILGGVMLLMPRT